MKKTGTVLAAFAASLLATSALAGEVRVMWYSDGVEGEVIQDLLNRFMKDNPDIKVTLDNVAYKVIQEQLPIQLESGQGPDIARVTNIKELAQHWLDLRPLVADAKYWDDNFGAQADWMRPDGSDAIMGFMTQLTLTGGFANKTLFEQAGVAMPGDKATWDDWIKASAEVMKSQKTAAAFAIDRSGHRISGAERLLWRELYRRRQDARQGRRRHQGLRHQAGRLDQGRADAEGDLGLRRRIDLSGRRRRLHQRPDPVLLFGQLAGREPVDQDRRQLRLGRDGLALRHRRLLRPEGRRRARGGEIHQEPGRRGEGDGLSRPAPPW